MYTPFSEEQSKVFVDTCQLYEALQSALQQAEHYKGSMRWKKSGGKEYLFKARDRKGYGSSLGPRSPETEAILNQFKEGKARVQSRLDNLKKKLQLQAKYNKANRLGRLPITAARTLRTLHNHGVEYTVIGTNAIYAYEALAGVQVSADILATNDIDILLDARKALQIACKLDDHSIVALMKRVDKTFEMAGNNHYRMVNESGYYVDFVTQAPKSVFTPSPFDQVIKGEVRPTDTVTRMDWILSAPALQQIVIAVDGLPAYMKAPDPRAFVLHKFFMSKAPIREPVKKRRDLRQAMDVARIIAEQLPQYQFDDKTIRSMPKVLRQSFSRYYKEQENGPEPDFW